MGYIQADFRRVELGQILGRWDGILEVRQLLLDITGLGGKLNEQKHSTNEAKMVKVTVRVTELVEPVLVL